MPTEHPACREADSDGSKIGVEAPWNEPASRSAIEPESASLHQVRSARLPNELKPEIRREEIFTNSGGDLRGEGSRRSLDLEPLIPWLPSLLYWLKNRPRRAVRKALDCPCLSGRRCLMSPAPCGFRRSTLRSGPSVPRRPGRFPARRQGRWNPGVLHAGRKARRRRWRRP